MVNIIEKKLTLPTKLKGLIVSLYFKEIKVYGKENIPKNAPVLYISNHRNGAIDGFVIMKEIPNAKFIVGKNLTHSWFLNLFFGGHIEVFRKAENLSEKDFNKKQLFFAAERISKKESVFVFPEGTSSLGPRLLPLKKGAAYICKNVRKILSEKDPFFIVPIGLHYVVGWSFRSRAEIHFGKPVRINKKDADNVENLTKKIESMLMDQMVTYKDSEEQKLTESLATFYFYSCLNSLQSREKNLNEISHLLTTKKINEIMVGTNESKKSRFFKKFRLMLNRKDLKYYNGAPIIQEKVSFLERLVYAWQTIILALAFIPNILVLLIPYEASKKLADDNNVVSLYKILAGVPVLFLQLLIIISTLAFIHNLTFFSLALVFYVFITLAALYSYDNWRRLRVILHNDQNPNKYKLLKLYKFMDKNIINREV